MVSKGTPQTFTEVVVLLSLPPQGVSRRVNHAVRYPVNCDPVDGVSPNLHAMQVYRTSCARCLQGEPVSNALFYLQKRVNFYLR